ncbi:MAG: alpha/beta hydrolase [Brumimicrobium sp.]
MRFLLTIIITSCVFFVNAQEKKNIYLFPGQGSDCRIFSKLEFDTNRFEVSCFDYGVPMKDESLEDFALRISKYIDTTREFVLIGVSLGGMLCTELAHQINPSKTIIISSAKTMHELPKKYTLQRQVNLYKVIPANWYKKGALFLQPIVEPDRRNEKSTFKAMLKKKSPLYFKRTVKMLVLWNRTSCTEEIIHIHGDKDHTIPLDNLKPSYIVKNGSHMMTLTRARDINKIIINTLTEDFSE